MSCRRCGQCCFPFGIALDYDADSMRWLTYHGISVRETEDGRMAIYGHSKCDMLIFTPDGKTACGVYADRPKICREYMCKRALEEQTTGGETE